MKSVWMETAEAAMQTVTDGIGVSLIETDLTTDIIDIQGDGSTGSSTTGSKRSLD